MAEDRVEHVDMNSGSEDEFSNKEYRDDGGVEEPRKMGRRYMKEEEREIDELGRRTVQDADGIATRWGRKRPDILIRAGLGIKSTKKDNISNIFKTWYAMKNDMDQGSKYLNYIFLHERS
jgi:hypothetical protein